VHVPYRGSGLAFTDVISGQVPVMFATVSLALPHVRAGRVRALASSAARRLAAMPELPTIAQGGVREYDFSTWYGLLVPARTPKNIVTTLHGQIVKILSAREMKDKLIAQGFEPVGGTPEEFGAYIKSEIAKWGKVIRTAGIKPE